MLRDLQSAFDSVGLEINAAKCSYLTHGIHDEEFFHKLPGIAQAERG